MGDKYRHFDARKNGKGNRHPILLKKNNYRCSPKKLHLLIELAIPTQKKLTKMASFLNRLRPGRRLICSSTGINSLLSQQSHLCETPCPLFLCAEKKLTFARQ